MTKKSKVQIIFIHDANFQYSQRYKQGRAKQLGVSPCRQCWLGVTFLAEVEICVVTILPNSIADLMDYLEPEKDSEFLCP